MALCYYNGIPANSSCTQLAVAEVWMRARGLLLCWWSSWCESDSFCRGARPKQRSVCMTCQSWLCAGQYADLLADYPQPGACLCSRRCDCRQSCHDVGYAGTHDSSVSPGSIVTHPGFANSVSMVCAGFLVCCLHKHVVIRLDVSRRALSFSLPHLARFSAFRSRMNFMCVYLFSRTARRRRGCLRSAAT